MNIFNGSFFLFLFLAGNVYGQPDTSGTGVFDSLLMDSTAMEHYSFHYHPGDDLYEFRVKEGAVSGGASAFPYLWKAIQGDFILRTEIVIENPGSSGFRAGWILGNTLHKTDRHIEASVSGNGSAFLDSGNNLIQKEGIPSAVYVVQIRREGDQFTMKTAPFGQILQTVETFQSDLQNDIFAGIFIKSGSAPQQQVQFRNVRIVKPHSRESQQAGSPLGSRLEVIDIESRQREILYESEHSIQAPNWSADGGKLLYNSKGYLFNYHLSDGHISLLNTGFANRNNNDHVISFDGEWLAISHHNESHGGESTIYILPVEGSDHPRQVTKSGLGASYLHGISPDNQTVLFTGMRNGVFDIYAADVNSMEETQLTHTPGLDDGSEYTPDGKHILFNSNRTGTMQIWRMNADGSDQTQLTFSEDTHDWFPHISPDGRWIVFLSYGLDVDSGDHPFYKEVMLQIMPAEGGEPEVIAYLFGGQGTINVPSWSPDSKKVAFVSNSGRY